MEINFIYSAAATQK